jgi:hypothetical protein
VLELILAHDVAECPDTVDVRPQVLVGRDVAIVVEPDAARRDREAIRVRNAARGDEQRVGPEFAACVLTGQLLDDVAILHTDSLDLGRQRDLEPPLEDPGEPVGDVFVLVVEDPRPANDERDVAAQRPEEMPELDGDEAAPRIASRRG